MPTRKALTPEQEQDVWRLWTRRTPRTAIARRFSVHPNTISKTVERILAGLASGREAALERTRDEAVAVYQAVQAEAWERLADCTPASNAAVGYLGAITDAQRQMDRLLGLEQITINHRGVHLARIEAILSSDVPIQLPGGDDAESP